MFSQEPATKWRRNTEDRWSSWNPSGRHAGGSAAERPGCICQEVNAEASPASWAIRFVASLPNVMVVLSGMSNREQMADNLSFMENFAPLDEAEAGAVEKARVALRAIDKIECTACRYCTGGCPMEINIPALLRR